MTSPPPFPRPSKSPCRGWRRGPAAPAPPGSGPAARGPAGRKPGRDFPRPQKPGRSARALGTARRPGRRTRLPARREGGPEPAAAEIGAGFSPRPQKSSRRLRPRGPSRGGPRGPRCLPAGGEAIGGHGVVCALSDFVAPTRLRRSGEGTMPWSAVIALGSALRRRRGDRGGGDHAMPWLALEFRSSNTPQAIRGREPSHGLRVMGWCV